MPQSWQPPINQDQLYLVSKVGWVPLPAKILAEIPNKQAFLAEYSDSLTGQNNRCF